MAKTWRCYLRSHRWVQRVQDGLAYYRCRDCGKEREPVHTGLPIIWPAPDRYDDRLR